MDRGSNVNQDKTARSPNRASLWVRLALLLFGLILSAGMAEVLLRTLGPSAAPWAKPVDADARDLPVLKDLWDISKPNVRGQFKGRLYTSNSAAFRGPEITVGKPAGTFRILLLGDSFTNGQGVRYEESYAALLSMALNRGNDRRRYEVLNLGIGGFNLWSSVHRLKTDGLKFDPDLVIYGYTANDIEGRAYRNSRSQERPDWRTPSRLLNLLGSQWDYLRDIFRPAKGSYTWELDDNYFRNPPAWKAWQDDLAELVQITDGRGLCLGIFLHTELRALHSLHTFRHYYEAVRTEAKRQGVPVLETFDYFKGRRAEDLWVDYFDHHPNAEGHRILTRALLDGLAALPAECWKGPRPVALSTNPPD